MFSLTTREGEGDSEQTLVNDEALSLSSRFTLAGSPRSQETTGGGSGGTLETCFQSLKKSRPPALLSCKIMLNKESRAPQFLSLEYCLPYLETQSHQLYIDLLSMKRTRGGISFCVDQQFCSDNTISSAIDSVPGM